MLRSIAATTPWCTRDNTRAVSAHCGASRYGRVGAPVRANWRVRKNLPVTITHAENTEVRAKPGAQAVVQFQAERRLPTEPVWAGNTPAVATGSLNNGVNRRSDNTLGMYNAGAGATGIKFNEHYKYLYAGDESRTLCKLNHRSDWTMFTNASLRDGLSALNGRFSSAQTLQAGYATPAETATPDPTWFRKEVTDVRDNGLVTEYKHPLTPISAIDYHHLYEEISWKVTNNAVVPCHVTVYECVLAHDIPFTATPYIDGVTEGTTQWGALPCPVELWRASRKLSHTTAGALYVLANGAGFPIGTANAYGGIEGDDGEGAVGTVMGAPVQAATAGNSGGGVNAATNLVSAQLSTKDVDQDGVKVGGQLLHHWYKVIPHRRKINPGQTATITIKVQYNKRIPGTWWESLIGIAGYSRAFFMVSRSEEAVGTTGLDEVGSSGHGSRYHVSGPTDLLVSWRKTKSFCRHDQLPRRSVVYNATVPYADSFTVRNPADNDAEGVVVHDFVALGGDGAGAGL